MNILCALHVHRPSAPGIWNRGYQFSRCARCGHDLIATDGSWERVPPGYRVVWKSGRHERSLANAWEQAPPLLSTAPSLAVAAILLEKLRPRTSARAGRGRSSRQRIDTAGTALDGPPIHLLVHLPSGRAKNPSSSASPGSEDRNA